MPTPKNEISVVNPTIKVWDSGTSAYVDKSAYLRCISLELNSGQIPSRAMFMQVYGRDVASPIVMKPPGTGQFKHGMRVIVQKDSTTLFAGWLLKRSDQGRNDKVIWQAYDDRILMQWVAMRGAIVYDPIDKVLRYSPRHPTTFNPNGFWNCTGYDIDGTVFPVFTNVSCRTQAYESPNAAYPTDPYAGQYNPWTPRRALKYLSLWATANILDPVPIGLDETQQSFLSAAGPFYIKVGDITGMQGYDPSDAPGTADPLDYKLQSLSVQGGSLFNAFGSILSAAGTHTLVVLNDSTEGETKLGYKNVGYFPLGYSSGKAIIIQRDGSVGQSLFGDETPNCWDFHFDEDASEICETSLVEGDVVRVESDLFFKGGVPTTDYSEDTTSDIIPAWSYAQEQAYLECIHGGSPGSPGAKYAKIAEVNGDTTTLKTCDGVDYVRPIRARDTEAVQAARDSFPHVFRAWKLNSRSSNMQTLLGVANGSNGGLKGARPILGQQLQFMMRNLAGGTGIENWMLTTLPIRVRFYDPDRDTYYEVPKDVGVRVTDDGLLWFDGLAEEASGTDNCLFSGSLTNIDDYTSGRIVLRQMRINCAFPTDTRLVAKKVVPAYANPSDDPLDDTIRGAFATGCGKLGRYQDAGKSFHRGVQKNSEPCLSPKYFGGTDGTSQVAIPLDRDLPPGSEETQAQFAAQRQLAKYQCPRRDATFSLIGINTLWGPGDRVDYVRFVSVAGTGDWIYYLRGSVGSVFHDFQAQMTTLNGLYGQYGNTAGG